MQAQIMGKKTKSRYDFIEVSFFLGTNSKPLYHFEYFIQYIHEVAFDLRLATLFLHGVLIWNPTVSFCKCL